MANIVLLSANRVADIFFVWAITDKMCIVIICFSFHDVLNFAINLNFLIKPFSYMTLKSQEKNLYILKKSF